MLHKQYIIDLFGNNPAELATAQAAAARALELSDRASYGSVSSFRVRRRERRIPRYPNRTKAVLCRWLQLLVLVTVLLAGVVAWLTLRPENPLPTAADLVRLPVGGDISAVLGAAASVGERRVYAFSVVPGGVTSQEELTRVVAADRVVARHYAEINVKAMHPVTAKAKSAYMSYRRGDQIFWTRHKVALKEGEVVLSDGEQEIRARCGNRISDVSRMPVADVDPPHDLLDSYTEVPVVVVVPAPKQANAQTQSRAAQQAAADIPEPSTVWLLATGVGGLVVFHRVRRRRAR